jgi:hypothetical protein
MTQIGTCTLQPFSIVNPSIVIVSRHIRFVLELQKIKVNFGIANFAPRNCRIQTHRFVDALIDVLHLCYVIVGDVLLKSCQTTKL